MKNKTFWIGFVIVYIVVQVLGYVVHELLLADTYKGIADVWRPENEMMSMMWMMFISSAIYLFLFCYIYTRFQNSGGIGGGGMYGLLMGLFMSVPMAFDSHVLYPIPLNLALIWLITGTVMFVIAGAIFGAIYKPARSAL